MFGRFFLFVLSVLLLFVTPQFSALAQEPDARQTQKNCAKAREVSPSLALELSHDRIELGQTWEVIGTLTNRADCPLYIANRYALLGLSSAVRPLSEMLVASEGANFLEPNVHDGVLRVPPRSSTVLLWRIWAKEQSSGERERLKYLSKFAKNCSLLLETRGVKEDARAEVGQQEGEDQVPVTPGVDAGLAEESLARIFALLSAGQKEPSLLSTECTHASVREAQEGIVELRSRLNTVFENFLEAADEFFIQAFTVSPGPYKAKALVHYWFQNPEAPSAGETEGSDPGMDRPFGFSEVAKLERLISTSSGTTIAEKVVEVSHSPVVAIVGGGIGGLAGYLFLYLSTASPKSQIARARAGNKFRESGNMFHLIRERGFIWRFAGGPLLSILVGVIVTIMLARLGETRFLVSIKINDLWGAIAMGLAAELIGIKLIYRLVNSGIPAREPEARPDSA